MGQLGHVGLESHYLMLVAESANVQIQRQSNARMASQGGYSFSY